MRSLLLERLNEKTGPAITDERGTHDYASVARGAADIAAHLLGRDKASLEGERVAMLVPPGYEFVATLFGILAALPSNTPRQLAGLARGIDGLRSPTVDDGSGEGEALRGRTAEVVRRVRVGGRDMFKLDVVEARLREADGHAAALFPEIVRRAAAAITRHAATMPPRTLLYVFGDHGFTLDASGAAYQGGASPEEVLVPAFAFLLGMVQ